jgi:hypothetical protein
MFTKSEIKKSIVGSLLLFSGMLMTVYAMAFFFK